MTHSFNLKKGVQEGTTPLISSITVKDVARKADVSVGTVSRVFNNHSNVTGEIRERVLKAAADLGYARSVSQDTPRSIRPIKAEADYSTDIKNTETRYMFKVIDYTLFPRRCSASGLELSQQPSAQVVVGA
jgi:transcriptional regulator with XRE-family HTH domain